MSKVVMTAAARRSAGFTLIEVMIVVVIVAILASIAYPSYQRYIQQTRRADAQTALMELAHFMERHYTLNGGYLDSNGAAPTLPFSQSPKDGGTAMYNLSLSSATAGGYTLQAVPAGAMAGDRCGTLTLTHLGVKGNGTGVALAECWKR